MKKSTEWLLVATFALGCSGGTQQERDVGDGLDGSLELSSDVVFVKDLPGVEGGLDLTAGDEAEAIPEEVLGPSCLPGEGCFLDPCDSNSDCISGWCVDHMADGVCTQTCEDECPLGFSCVQVTASGPDLAYVCVSNYTSLCRPCATNADCKSSEGVEDTCLSYGEEGAFCGAGCGEGKVCPQGFTCKDALTVDGIELKQCVANGGMCPCTKKSVELALWTPCSASSEWGTCYGKRVCMPDGLAACDALVPAVDVCNGADDDCDGQTDEETCDDENPCTDDSCTGRAGCLNEPNNDTCEDGDPCTFGDKCVGGECVSGFNPLYELCNGVDDDCDGSTDEGFDLGTPCTVGTGTCLAEGVTVCFEGGYTSVCGAEALEPVAELCNGLDDDCDGPVDEDFALGAPCTSGVGACMGQGQIECALDGKAVCSGVVGEPSDEVCDGIDNDCDGLVDNLTKDSCQLSNAWGVCPGTEYCLAGGATICLGVYPTSEACNGKDDDCDGAVDEGYEVGGQCKAGKGICQVDGTVVCTEDGTGTVCDGQELPPGEEACNKEDDDCDGFTDEEGAQGCKIYMADMDEDGFGDDGDSRCLCEPESPYTAPLGGDCSDKDASVNPSSIEACNGKDDDCDTEVDEHGSLGCALFYVDGDKDGYGKEGEWKCLCAPDGDYILIIGGDCNDGNPAIRPGAAELCNAVDDDCDGETDEGFVTGGACTVGVGACAAGGTVVCTPDGKKAVCSAVEGQPSPEKCNGVDDDCNGSIDEGFPGVGAACQAGIGDCKMPGTFICTPDGLGLTCNAPVKAPGNELCGGGDEDCDGSTDEENAGGCKVFFIDSDGDGHGLAGQQKCLCLPAFPYTATIVGDCDDKNAQAKPGGTEKCGGADEDCDGQVDEEGASGCKNYYPDADGDGYGPSNLGKCLCAAVPPLTVLNGNDCDDWQVMVNPAAKEVCGGGDENCNGQVDEAGAAGCVTAYQDVDGDGHGTKTEICSCKIGQGYVGFILDDCDDSNPDIFAGAAEFCNGLDDDCDGKVDDGYDLQGDPSHCGKCNNPCPKVGPMGLEHTCVAGVCVIKQCPEGKFDADMDPNNGCEVNGKIIYVDDSNATGVENGTLANPYKTINLALFFAEPQTLVHVFNGTYNEKVVVETKGVTIRGESRAGVIISQTDPLFATVESKANSFTLKNLTVKGFHYGVKLSSAKLNVIQDVDVVGSGVAAPSGVDAAGVWLSAAQENTILGLSISAFRGGTAAWGTGVKLSNSIHNHLANNAISNIQGPDAGDPTAGAVALFISDDSWDNDVKTTNTADGSPIVYLFRQHGVTVSGLDLTKALPPTNLGKMVAVESKQIVFKDNKVSSYKGLSPTTKDKPPAPGYGVRILSCPGVKVQNNTISSIDGGNGASLTSGSFETAPAGAVSYGIRVENSPSAEITGNFVFSVQGGDGGKGTCSFCYGGTGGEAKAVLVSGSALASVTGNDIHDVIGGDGGNAGPHVNGGVGGAAWGIEITNSAGSTASLNKVHDMVGGIGGLPGQYNNSKASGGGCRGLAFTKSTGMTIASNVLTHLQVGPSEVGQQSSTVVGFALSEAAQALLDSNQLTDLIGANSISSHVIGFSLTSSAACTMKKNVATGFQVNQVSSDRFFLYLDSKSENVQVSQDNLADGDPVIFLHGAAGKKISKLVLDSPVMASNYGKVTVLFSSGVVLEDLEVRNQVATSVQANGIRLVNCATCIVNRVVVDNIQGSTSVGVLGDASTGLVLSNLTVHGVGKTNQTTGKGIHLTATASATVSSSILSGVQGHCAYNENKLQSMLIRYSLISSCSQSSIYNNNAETNKLLYLDPSFVNEAAGDLHLKNASVALDAGAPEGDYCGEPNPNGCRIDMGGFGGTAATTTKAGAQHCPCN